MDETIDTGAVILQLQLENEMLRNAMKGFESVQQTVNAVPHFVETMWHKATMHKYQLLVGLMIVYWIATLALMVYDRMKS